MSRLSRFNEKLTASGGRITLAVGTMYVAILFALLTLISLPAVIMSGNVVVIITWITQSFLQLVLLPIIIVGQNVQGAAAEARSAALAAASDARSVKTLADVDELLSIQTVHIAKQHERTRAHLTALVASTSTDPSEGVTP